MKESILIVIDFFITPYSKLHAFYFEFQIHSDTVYIEIHVKYLKYVKSMFRKLENEIEIIQLFDFL